MKCHDVVIHLLWHILSINFLRQCFFFVFPHMFSPFLFWSKRSHSHTHTHTHAYACAREHRRTHAHIHAYTHPRSNLHFPYRCLSWLIVLNFLKSEECRTVFWISQNISNTDKRKFVFVRHDLKFPTVTCYLLSAQKYAARRVKPLCDVSRRQNCMSLCSPADSSFDVV